MKTLLVLYCPFNSVSNNLQIKIGKGPQDKIWVAGVAETQHFLFQPIQALEHKARQRLLRVYTCTGRPARNRLSCPEHRQ